jgi:tetratricopeptide (TPR) repeat protein
MTTATPTARPRPLLGELVAAAEAQPGEAGPQVMLADAFRARGETSAALPRYARAARLAPQAEAVWLRWAGTLFAAGDLARAAAVLREAQTRLPLSPAVAGNLAEALRAQGRAEEATGLFALAARRGGAEDALLTGLCECCLMSGGDWRAAQQEAARWLGWPDPARLLPFTGRALLAAGRLADAEACFRELLSGDPRHAGARKGLGDIAAAPRDPAQALRDHLAALALDPADGICALACLFDYLTAERYPEAREFFRPRRDLIRARWGHGPHYLGLAPEWDGRAPLRDKTILVHGTVGLGDTIQFARFVALLKEQGARVILEAAVPLGRLLEACADADQVVAKFDPLPALDFECDAREIFLLCDVPVARIGGAVPYLPAGKAARERWRLPRDGPVAPVRVGIVWAASGLFSHGALGNRSMPFAEVKALAQRLTAPGGGGEPAVFQLVNLQAGPAREQLRGMPPEVHLVDPMGDVTDFLDTAGIVSHLDAVLTIDTSVAHLAGAMGKRTLVLLPYGASWRWGQAEGGSSWYPPARLFRQRQPGVWVEPITTCADSLREGPVRSLDSGPHPPPPSWPDAGRILGAPA